MERLLNSFATTNSMRKTCPGALKTPLRFNDFGWDVGGPIKRGKLFFFAGEEWKRYA